MRPPFSLTSRSAVVSASAWPETAMLPGQSRLAIWISPASAADQEGDAGHASPQTRSVLFPGESRLRREFADDDVVQPGAGVLRRDAERVLDRPVAGTAVADDADAVDAQERRPAVGAVVVAVHQRLQRLLRLAPLLVERG